MTPPVVSVESDFASPLETIAQYRRRTAPPRHQRRLVRRVLRELGRHLSNPETRIYL